MAGSEVIRVEAPATVGGPVQAPPAVLARRRIVRAMLSDRTALAGLVLVLAFAVMAAAAPAVSPHDPVAITGRRLEPPSGAHPLGTDGLGRDLLARLAYGARLSLGSALVAAAVVITLGVAVGTVSGYYGGLLDAALMRLVDVVLAVPGLILALAIAGLFRPGLLAVLLGLTSIWWVSYARIVRGLVLAVRERGFVESARALGAGNLRILARHVLPNVLSPVVVLATLEMGHLILAISGLSFLGLGAQPPTPEWGAMLNEGRTYFFSDPQVILVPGVAISLAVLGFNLLGDGIRDALDVRLR